MFIYIPLISDVCLLNCKNGGRCVKIDEFKSYKCACFGLHVGEFCEYDALIILLVGSIITIITFLAFIIIWVYCFKSKKGYLYQSGCKWNKKYFKLFYF